MSTVVKPHTLISPCLSFIITWLPSDGGEIDTLALKTQVANNYILMLITKYKKNIFMYLSPPRPDAVFATTDYASSSVCSKPNTHQK